MKHHRHEKTIGDRFKALIAYDPLAGFRKKRRRHGGRVNLASHISEQAKAVDTAPTDGQKEAGNYRKGHVKVHGLDISIENPRGSYRSGVADGRPWRSRLSHHYGYVRKTESGDGDHLDVYLGPHLKAPNVYVIDQHHLGNGDWDEHKSFIGFGSKSQAVNAYHRAFSDGKGKDRIGHVETMTIDGFKDWLKNADTTQPVEGHRRRFAAGGAVEDIPHMADGGSPVTDPTILAKLNEPTPVTDPKILEQLNAPAEPDRGALSAALQGAKAGATFNFNDELAGAHAAGPTVPSIGPIPGALLQTGIGAARVGYDALTGRDKEATANYERARDEERKAGDIAHEQHPYWKTAGEVAGALPAMAALPEAGFGKAAIAAGAKAIPRVGAAAVDSAILGGEYGGLTGLGEGKETGERALKSAEGIVSGIVGGAAAPVAGEVAGAAYNKFARPTVDAMRGWANPEGEAARRLARALQADQKMIEAGTAKGMSPQEWAAARAAGEPVTLAELGAGNTQALLRSAANTSPEGRAALEKVIEERFAGQSERVADEVRGLVAGGANAQKTGDQLVAEYDRARVPGYRNSFREGDKEITSPVMERLMGSPMFEQAMKSAVTTGKDRAITEGYGAFNPGVTVENGMIKFTKMKPNGVPQYPNLQYWDSVKKELDAVANVARRSGDKGKAEVAGNLAKTLRGELDAQVPSYGEVRGVAAQYFGENNALEAGQKLAGKKVEPRVINDLMRKMKPDERELFREGYASDWSDRVIKNISDTRDITKAMFNSPNERARALAVFGPHGMAKMEARMSLETIMDGARRAMGNSTTARQLIEAGLAGGAIEGYASGWDPAKMAIGAGAAATGRAGLAHAAIAPIAASARQMIGKVDAKTARLVAELLTSNDPTKLQQGLRMAQKNQRIADGLKRIATYTGLASQTKAIPRLPIDTTGWGAVGGHAEDKQQEPPRP